DGGGIFALVSEVNSQLSLEDIKFEECTVDENQYGYGGGAYIIVQFQASCIINKVQFKDCNAYREGGGIFVNGFGQMNQIINRTQFTNCEVYWNGGGMIAEIPSENSILELIGVIFENCNSLDYDGGGIYLTVSSEAQLILSETCLFKDCSSSQAGGGCYFICHNSSSKIQINGELEFDNCSSTYAGGGMFIIINNQQTIDINQMQFKDCSAKDGGGILISVYGGKTNILNQCLFTKCKSISGNGGGICSDINDGTLNIEDTTFNSCSCTQPGDGGALYLIQGSSSIISITNSSFINCKTISNSSNQIYGWGGAIFIQTLVTASNLNESNFLMRDLIFNGCSAVNSIGNIIHIQSVNTLATGESIKNGNLLTVNETTNLYENKLYGSDYMGIDESKAINGNAPISNHEPLFVNPPYRIFLNPYLVNVDDGIDNVFCGESDMPCKRIKYILNLDGTKIQNYNKDQDIITINLTSQTELENDIQINSLSPFGSKVIIQSDGYSPEAEEDNYLKQSISTSLFSNSLFTISETGDLSLLGLHFDNLNPSSTNALISITSNDYTQEPKITIIDCEFNQDSSSYSSSNSSSSLSHSIISIDGGQMSIIRTSIENYKFSNDKSYLMIQSDQISSLVYRINNIIIIESTFSNIQQFGTGNGTAINAHLQTGSYLLIDNSKFNQCKGSSDGGAIYLNISNQVQVTISNSTFDQCEAYSGGGIYASIYTGGKLIIDGQCKFTECNSSEYGGGIRVNIFDLDSQLTLEDGVKFEDCTSTWGGGILISLYGGKINILNQCLFKECKSISGNGGGIFSDINDGTVYIEDTTFNSCSSTQPGDGGALALYQKLNSIISITNSSFINCKTISNPLEQNFGWGGAINIQFNMTAENLNESNFLMRDLIFIGCSAVNSIGNNIHIESDNILATGESIKNGNLITVKDLSNPPNIISDLYTS
ncbi:MAG: hypothetical protein EZS28_033613, partial [Streblomastix strix]